MAIPGAVEISGRDLPQYDPSSERDGSRLGYPDETTTLFLINDTSKDVEKNIRLNQVDNITSGINVYPGRGSGMVNRDFTGFSFDFKSIRSGDDSVTIFTDGPTGEVIKIKSNALYSGVNLGVVDPYEQRQYFGTVCSGKTHILEDGNNLSAIAFRSVTGGGNIIVTGVLQSELRQAQYNEDTTKRLWYKAYSGTQVESNSDYGDQLNLLWREGQVPYGENLFMVSSIGAEVGYMCITARQEDQTGGIIPLDFSKNRIIFLDIIGYRGINWTSYINILPQNLKVGTTITMQVFPRSPFENVTSDVMNRIVQGLMQLDPDIFKVVGKSPYPFVTNDLTNGWRAVQPVRIHFLCVKDTISVESEIPGQAQPSILISFNDIEADFAWNTNLYLGKPTDDVNEDAAEKYKGGLGYTTKGTFGYAHVPGEKPGGATDKWLPRSFPSLPSRYYPMRSYFALSSVRDRHDFADNRPYWGGRGNTASLARRGVNNSYLFGTIDYPPDYNNLLQSHRLYTGYDYRYKNTGLNLP